MNLFAEFSSNPGNEPALNDLVIRPARETDVPALAQITAEREGGSATAFDSQKVFVRRSLETDRVLLLVAEIASEVIGFGKVTHFSPAVGSPPDVAPEGWYLSGVIVTPRYRRRGVGNGLTRARLGWIAGRSSCAYYFASARNEVTIALHRYLGFVELTREFSFPGASFTGGVGVLFRADLTAVRKLPEEPQD